MTVETFVFWCGLGALAGGLIGHLRGVMGLGMVLGLMLGPLFGPLAVMLFTLRGQKPDPRHMLSETGSPDRPQRQP